MTCFLLLTHCWFLVRFSVRFEYSIYDAEYDEMRTFAV